MHSHRAIFGGGRFIAVGHDDRQARRPAQQIIAFLAADAAHAIEVIPVMAILPIANILAYGGIIDSGNVVGKTEGRHFGTGGDDAVGGVGYAKLPWNARIPKDDFVALLRVRFMRLFEDAMPVGAVEDDIGAVVAAVWDPAPVHRFAPREAVLRFSIAEYQMLALHQGIGGDAIPHLEERFFLVVDRAWQDSTRAFPRKVVEENDRPILLTRPLHHSFDIVEPLDHVVVQEKLRLRADMGEGQSIVGQDVRIEAWHSLLASPDALCFLSDFQLLKWVLFFRGFGHGLVRTGAWHWYLAYFTAA